jgi:RimJ/RimL family protein N-acetyltransferase
MQELDPEESAFQERWGPWQPWDLDAVAAHLDGLDVPWWVCGGYAIEAFTGQARRHDDVDIGIFRADLPALRRHFEGSMHLWSAGSGMLRPLDEQFPEPHPESQQVWLRENSLAPWVADVILAEGDGGRWVFKRDPRLAMSLVEATWIDDRGRRIQRPEIVLAHKAQQHRSKDDLDFAAAWPRLDRDSRDWLRGFVERLVPDHPWASRMRAPDEPVGRQGSLVRLREAELADAQRLDTWYADRPRFQGEFNDFGPIARRSFREVLDRGGRAVSHESGLLLVERIADGVLLGDVGWHLVRYGPNAESVAPNIGISLEPDARGRGYGTEAQRLLAEVLFDLYDPARVEASTDVANVPEQRALEKAGYRREGVLRQAQYRQGAYHDLVVYSLVRSDLARAGET